MSSSSATVDRPAGCPRSRHFFNRNRLWLAGDGNGRRARATRGGRAGASTTGRRWGPYLAERQWGTVREDYSAERRRAGTTSRTITRAAAPIAGARTACSASAIASAGCASRVALWNGKDPILKERLFGLTGPEGNHGEDVKELYYYLDATPTLSYLQGALQVPAARVPVRRSSSPRTARRGKQRARVRARGHRRVRRRPLLRRARRVREGGARRPADPRSPSRTAAPSAADAARAAARCGSATPGRGDARGEGYDPMRLARAHARRRASSSQHRRSGRTRLSRPTARSPSCCSPTTRRNAERLCGVAERDAVHQGRVPRLRRRRRRRGACNPAQRGHEVRRRGTVLDVPAGGERRAAAAAARRGVGVDGRRSADFDAIVRTQRIAEADALLRRAHAPITDARSARSSGRRTPGCCGRKQFYHYVVERLAGGRSGAAGAAARRARRAATATGQHLYNRDVISMPDSWEYPWFAAWDLAFHMVPMARFDPQFAKEQLAAAPARVVHAPERAAAGVRVRVRRRESAGARVGGAGGSTRSPARPRRGATARSSSARSTSC